MDSCDSLYTSSQKDQLERIASQFYMYDCYDGTLADALNEANPSLLALHLQNYICWLINLDKTDEKIIDTLNKRAILMSPFAQVHSMDITNSEAAGDTSAPVIITVYACLSCSMCRFIIQKLYYSVIDGELKNKAVLYMRLFTISNHNESKSLNKALLSSEKLNHFWDFFNCACDLEEDLDENSIDLCVEQLELSWSEFMLNYTDSTFDKELDEIKKEGRKNNISVTPTFFINGRRYRGYKNPEIIIDTVIEEYERLTGQLCDE